MHSSSTDTRAHTGHSHGPHAKATDESQALRFLLIILIPIIVATLIGLILLWPKGHAAADDTQAVTLRSATITAVQEQPGGGGASEFGQDDRPGAVLQVRVNEGPDAGTTVPAMMQPAIYDAGAQVGDTVKVSQVESPQGGRTYQFVDFDRTTPLIVLAVAFAALLVLVARGRGARALVGLGFSAFLIIEFMLPALAGGAPPTLVALTAGTAILTVVLYITHGFSARTTTALLGTIAGMLAATGLGVLFVQWAHLTGVTDEEDLLLWHQAPEMQLPGVVLCATIITAVGVLNDVTITQASAVWELASSGESRRQLFHRAMRIGRDHVASSTYTVAFGATGAALATYLLLAVNESPLHDVVILERYATEIITILVGALAVLMAMPLTTALAVVTVSTYLDAPRDE